MRNLNTELDFFVSFSALKEENISQLKVYWAQSNLVELYYGESFYINIVCSRPIVGENVTTWPENEGFRIEGTLLESLVESVTSASNYPKVNAFSLMCSGIPSFIWVEDDKQYALWACLAQLDSYSYPNHKLEIHVYKHILPDLPQSSEVDRNSETEGTREENSNTSDWDEQNEYVSEVEGDYNLLGSLSNDIQFRSNPPVISGAYVFGESDVANELKDPSRKTKTRKKVFECSVPVVLKLRSYALNESNQYITSIVSPDSSCENIRILGFKAETNAATISLFAPKTPEKLQITLSSSDVFTIIHLLQIPDNIKHIELQCFCKVIVARKLSETLVESMPFTYKHPPVLITRRTPTKTHTKQLSSSGNVSAAQSISSLNLLEISASSPSYVPSGSSFSVRANLYNPLDFSIDLLIRIPLYCYDDCLSNKEHSTSKSEEKSSELLKYPNGHTISPGIIALSTKLYTGSIFPKCEKDFDLHFLAYKPGSYDLSSISIEDVNHVVHKPRKLSKELQIIVT
ncbi:hypothetical protein POMI540_1042 [Schizosaccharomyces pombe]